MDVVCRKVGLETHGHVTSNHYDKQDRGTLG